jgi:hypothetical protein
VTTRSIAALIAVLAVLLLPQAREATQAQSPPGQSNQPPPTFSSRADAVWLTVFVTDQAGRPVRGLTADDFEVLEKGQPRDITTFQGGRSADAAGSRDIDRRRAGRADE